MADFFVGNMFLKIQAPLDAFKPVKIILHLRCYITLVTKFEKVTLLDNFITGNKYLGHTVSILIQLVNTWSNKVSINM